MSDARDPTTASVPGSEAGACGGMPRRRRWRRLLPFALLVAGGVALAVSGLHRHLSLDAFVARRGEIAALVDANLAAAALGLALLYTAAVALSLPIGLPLTLAAGFLFGPVAGGAIVAVSATAGATILFLLARGALAETLEARAGPRVRAFADGFRGDAFNYLLFLRLVPVAPFWLVNLAPAILGVPLRTFVGATAIGILPATFAFATLGAGIDSVVAAREEALEGCSGAACEVSLSARDLVTPELLAGLAALGLLALVPVVVRRIGRKKEAGR